MKTQINIFKCSCGAITIFYQNEKGEEVQNSMPVKLFKKYFPTMKVPEENNWDNCNYCVNNWGIDLCACGSGEKFNKCKEGFPECGTPMQELNVKQLTSIKF